MSSAQILFPIGRLVGGSLYKARTVTENDGKTPKLDRDGKPRKSYSFAVAIPKTGTDWKQTPWGQKIHKVAVDAFPNGEYMAPAFAWKITDGDSGVPNKKGVKPNSNEGWPGNWVVWFSSEAVAPKLTDKMGTREGTMTYADGVERIKPGHLIEVLGFVKDNAPSPSPGVYMNYEMVAHNDATTPEITLRNEIDSTQVGFGGGAAPAAQPPAAAPAPVAPPAAPAPTAVQPNQQFLAPPPAPNAPPPAPPAGPQMTAKANGVTYEAYRQAGWTDEQLRQNGLMV